MLDSVATKSIAPIAGIPIVHELNDGIDLVGSDVDWRGTIADSIPVVIRHEIGNARPVDMRPILHVPPWCTFHLDARGEPASLFHAVFGEVDRLLVCDEPGVSYVVRYAASPTEPVVALQSELTAFSFALSARGAGLIAHACAFVTPAGLGVLCPGVSGTGKTTLARLIQRAALATSLLTDDRAIVTERDGRLSVAGSPWPGAARVAGAGSAPLDVVVFIRHGGSLAIRELSAADAFRRVVNTLSMPLWEPARCGRALEIVDALVSRTRLVELEYSPTVETAHAFVEDIDRSLPLGNRAA